MSLNTKYGGYLIRWSWQTFDIPVREALFPGYDAVKLHEGMSEEEVINLTSKCRIVDDFFRYFGDPRCNHYGNHLMSVKDEFFPDFKAWCEKQGYLVDKPEPAFRSMTVMSSSRLTIDSVKEIKEIIFK